MFFISPTKLISVILGYSLGFIGIAFLIYSIISNYVLGNS